MKKRIVICWRRNMGNTPDNSANGVPYATNVVRIAEKREAYRQRQHGRKSFITIREWATHGGSVKRVFDGATGSGISFKHQRMHMRTS